MTRFNFYIERTVSIRKRDYYSVESDSLEKAIDDADKEIVSSEDYALLENTIKNIINDNAIVYDSKLILIKEL